MEYKLFRINPFPKKIDNEGKSIIPNKLKNKDDFYCAKSPRKELIFKCEETNATFITTDIDLVKYKRNNKIEIFKKTFEGAFRKRDISVLLIEVEILHFKTFSNFVKHLYYHFKKWNINFKGYCWVRDIGEIKFRNHFQVVLATTRIEKGVFREIFLNKKNNHFNISFCNNFNTSINYLKRKSVYGNGKEKSYAICYKF
jgi:hypothetical protein